MFNKRKSSNEINSGNGAPLTEETVQTAEESLYYKSIADALLMIELEKEIQKRSESSKTYKSC